MIIHALRRWLRAADPGELDTDPDAALGPGAPDRPIRVRRTGPTWRWSVHRADGTCVAAGSGADAADAADRGRRMLYQLIDRVAA